MINKKQSETSDMVLPRRKGRSRWIIWGGLLVIVILLLTLMTRSSEESGIEVDVDTVATRTIVETVVAPGVVRPAREVVISPEISGEIVFLGVEEGDRVNAGQVLLRINPAAIVAEREQAEAALLSAQSAEASAKARLLKLEQDLARGKELRSKDLITPQEFEGLESQVVIARTDVESAGFGVRRARAALSQVRESLSRTTVTAPISGVVTKLQVKEGEKVVGAIQMTGTEIMTIADFSEVEAHVEVVETDIVGIDPGESAVIELDAFPDEQFIGTVSQIANAPNVTLPGASGEMATFLVRLRILDPDTRIRSGMRVTATITTAQKQNVPSVPIQAVTIRTPQEENRTEVEDARGDSRRAERPDPIVFLLDNGSALPRVVRTGVRDDRYIEILSGVAPGDPVISGPYGLVSRDLDSGDVVRVSGSREAAGE